VVNTSEVGAHTRSRSADVFGPGGRSAWRWAFAWPAALLFVAVTFFAGDLAADFAAGIRGTHLLAETMALALAVVGAAGAAWHLWRAISRARGLGRTPVELDQWRAEAHAILQRLGSALDRQFQRWGLTEAERETALLILKGLGEDEVATARGVTERTVRYQALAIYRKAGLAGRSELAAFLLQDLRLPRRPAGGGGAKPATDAESGAGAVLPTPDGAPPSRHASFRALITAASRRAPPPMGGGRS
jgi:DNA-binding CsgD family transcriptional regulator